MGSEQRSKVLKVALASGSLLIIGVGLYFAIGGESWGWLIVAFGVFDLATMPFVARIIGRQQGEITKQATEAKAEGTPEANPDPSYNPYARED